MSVNTALALGSGLALAGVVASKLSARLGVPALLLFLGVGMLAGSDGPGGVHFEDHELAQTVGIVALAYILFSGGLDTVWSDVRPVLARGIALATVGVLVTAAIVGVVATWALDVPLETGLLVGAIVSSTDAAAVFSVLRSRSVRLRGTLRPLLELESGSNDPMAVFLTIGLLELVTEPSSRPIDLLPLFGAQMVIGALAGVGAGRLGVWLLNRIRLDHEGLYPVLLLAMVAFTYGVTALLQGSGFLAVYLMGLEMGRRRFIHKNSLARFHDAVAWVGQIAMFVVLGLLVFPSELPGVAAEGLLVAAALVFVARPAAVFLALAPFRVPWRECALVSWVGLRGAAPIILATFPLMERAPGANLIFDTVFFIVLTSVLLQGTTIAVAARRFGVADAHSPRAAWPLELSASSPDGADLHEVVVAAGAPASGRAVVELGLPAGTMLVLVRRDNAFTVPTGATVLQPDDELLVIGPDDGVDFLRRLARPGARGDAEA
jgi:cell volume regulation protein A